MFRKQVYFLRWQKISICYDIPLLSFMLLCLFCMMEPVEKKEERKTMCVGEGRGRDLSNGPTYNIVVQWFSTFLRRNHFFMMKQFDWLVDLNSNFKGPLSFFKGSRGCRGPMVENHCRRWRRDNCLFVYARLRLSTPIDIEIRTREKEREKEI